MWLCLVTSPRAGFSHERSVIENYQVGLADGLGEFRCKLMHGQNARCVARNGCRKMRRNFPAEALTRGACGRNLEEAPRSPLVAKSVWLRVIVAQIEIETATCSIKCSLVCGAFPGRSCWRPLLG